MKDLKAIIKGGLRMKKRIFVPLLVGLMLLAIPNFALAQRSGDMIQDRAQEQPQVQIQKQDRDQININQADQEQSRQQLADQDQVRQQLADQEQVKQQLRDRLHLTDTAMAQQQERLRLQDPTQAECRFPDMEQHWARTSVQSAYNWGLTNGYPDGRFNPNGNITGPEGVVMMTRLMNCLGGIEAGATPPGAINWEGVPDWAKAQLQERNALRIMAQTPFYAEPQLNRYQFCVMLAKALGIEAAAVPDGTVVFSDQAYIAGADLGYIQALKNMGVVVGDNGNFYPGQLVTRAEAASMLARTIDILQ